MKRLRILSILALLLLFCLYFAFWRGETFDRTWNSLLERNQKFIEDRSYSEQRKSLIDDQNPYVVVLSCSDSRVPPELIFGTGLGELFTVRVAGEVVDSVVLDSLEYAVSHFDASCLVVMGHSDCGAVRAALGRLQQNQGLIELSDPDPFLSLLIPIEKAIVDAHIDIHDPNALTLAIRANVSCMAHQLMSESKMISDLVTKGKLRIIGTEYSLATGKVTQLFVIDGIC